MSHRHKSGPGRGAWTASSREISRQARNKAPEEPSAPKTQTRKTPSIQTTLGKTFSSSNNVVSAPQGVLSDEAGALIAEAILLDNTILSMLPNLSQRGMIDLAHKIIA